MEVRAARAGMGRVARRGARQLSGEAASTAWQREVERARERWERGERATPEVERWVDEGLAGEAQAAVARGAARPARRPTTARPADEAPRPRGRRGPKTVPDEVLEELQEAVGLQRAARLAERVAEARDDLERGRDLDARRILAKVAAEAPGAPSVRELHGLALYRLGRYRQAAAELETFRELAPGDTTQHPVLADCYRALRRYDMVEELWDELRAASPSAEIVAEGRIVMAGALADRGELPAAIRLLERAGRPSRRVATHHLRTWYALADLLERAGDVPAARNLFRRIQQEDPRFVDVAERLAALR